MATTVHIEGWHDTEANIRTNADEYQRGFQETDDYFVTLDASAANIIYCAHSKSVTTAGGVVTYLDDTFNSLSIVETESTDGLQVAQFIRHYGDTDTRIEFGTDLIKLTAGATDYINIQNTTQDIVEINPAEGDVDFIVNAGAADTIFAQGSTGNVGINTNSPAELLDVSNSANAFINISTTGTTALTGLNFGDSGDSDIGRIRYNHTDDSMTFSTAATAAMVIDSSQRIGIPIDDPVSLLTIQNDTAWDTDETEVGQDAIFLSSEGITPGSGNFGASIALGELGVADGRGGVIAAVQLSADPDQTGMAFFTHPSTTGTDPIEEIMRLTDNVGINVTDPDTMLEVMDAAATQLKLSFDGTDNATFGVDTSGRLNIVASGGFVGIGVTDPDAALEVLTATTQIKCSHDGTDNATLGRNATQFVVTVSDNEPMALAGSSDLIIVGGSLATNTITDSTNGYIDVDPGFHILADSIFFDDIECRFGDDSDAKIEFVSATTQLDILSTVAGGTMRIENTSDTNGESVKIRAAGTGGVQIGGTDANYSQFEGDGTLEFVGDATVFEDANIDLSPLQTGGTKPGFVTLAGTNIRLLSFADGEDVDGTIEIPHSYKLNSTITPHIHFVPTAAPTGTDQVKFELEYTILDTGDVANASATVDTGDIAVDTQWETIFSDFGTFTHDTLGGQIAFKVSRVLAAGDAYAGEAGVLTFGFHYEIDTVGSRQITTK